MKKLFIILIFTLACGFFAQAQEADYQPLVREGVRWAYVQTDFEFDTLILCDDYEEYIYKRSVSYVAYEFKGDTLMNGSRYKKLYRFKAKDGLCNHETTTNGLSEFSEVLNPVAYLREHEKKVYYWDSRIGKEKWLYDYSDDQLAHLFAPFDDINPDHFNDPICFEDAALHFRRAGEIELAGHSCRVYERENSYDNDLLIDGIGFVSKYCGDFINQDPYWYAIEGWAERYTECGLSHVIDTDGNIIYRGPNYSLFANDINGDGQVDIADVNEVINVMLHGLTPSPSLEGEGSPADVTGDGQVDIADVNAVINAMLGK